MEGGGDELSFINERLSVAICIFNDVQLRLTSARYYRRTGGYPIHMQEAFFWSDGIEIRVLYVPDRTFVFKFKRAAWDHAV